MEVASRLLRFLKQDFDQAVTEPPHNLDGSYRSARALDDQIETTDLQLSLRADEGLIDVVETQTFYWNHDKRSADDFDETEFAGHKASTEKNKGWAILTPEDNLLFFMKREFGRNHYFLTLAHDDALWSDRPVEKLVLLHHEYPYELSTDQSSEDEILDTVSAHQAAHTRLFTRTGEGLNHG